ncbi:hypothetical protein LZ31DRAFT_246708 [Colletotrichum somersetense]|nr:hypothetical protein LZ31DRAFT_246708 [Colletotrichum somersetense]
MKRLGFHPPGSRLSPFLVGGRTGRQGFPVPDLLTYQSDTTPDCRDCDNWIRSIGNVKSRCSLPDPIFYKCQQVARFSKRCLCFSFHQAKPSSHYRLCLWPVCGFGLERRSLPPHYFGGGQRLGYFCQPAGRWPNIPSYHHRHHHYFSVSWVKSNMQASRDS